MPMVSCFARMCSSTRLSREIPEPPWVQEKPPQLTPTVHNALIALGRAAATVVHEHAMITNVPYMSTCIEAANYMLLGCEYDFAVLEFATQYRRHSDLIRARKIIRSLPKSSPAAFQRAAAVYKKVVASDRLYVDRSYGRGMRGMSDEVKARLASNAQDLDWCNDVWRKLFASGATKVDAVELFVSIIMASTLVHRPVPDFPSQQDSLGTIRTLDELKVIQLSASVRTRLNWRLNDHDNNTVSIWREEARNQDFTPSMIEFLIAELYWFAEQYELETSCEHGSVPGVFLSDSLFSDHDRTSLRIGADALAAITENRKDWNPNSHEQVLDLVHPSLYPYVRWRTRRYVHEDHPVKAIIDLPVEPVDMDVVASSVLRAFDPPLPPNRFSAPVAALSAAGCGVPTSFWRLRANFVERMWKSYSNYQWLPVDADVSAGPPHTARFLSYINNLHPAPETPGGLLYPILETLFARFIPLFERTLTDTRLWGINNKGVRTEFLPDSPDDYWDLPQPKHRGETDSESIRVFDERYNEWKILRNFVRPVVKPFVPPRAPGPAQVTLGGRVLQVIVKMVNVILTPEKPKYAGRAWALDGSDNERIVATGIYYFGSENITESSLSFRQDVLAPQGEYDHDYIEHLYGINEAEINSRKTQYLGAVTTPEGRCVCYPNGMSHRASSFSLLDPTKLGHQKMVVFYLVDPSRRILSTLDVPPQQLEWFLREIRLQAGTRLYNLPPELFNLICEHVRVLTDADEEDRGGASSKWLMTLTEAKEHRLRLVAERVRE